MPVAYMLAPMRKRYRYIYLGRKENNKTATGDLDDIKCPFKSQKMILLWPRPYLSYKFGRKLRIMWCHGEKNSTDTI